jgi:hypothetical protein
MGLCTDPRFSVATCYFFQVGVFDGCGVNGMIVVYRPSFFGSDVFAAPTPVYLSMDDIWVSGSLAAASVQRWVVPLLGREARRLESISVKTAVPLIARTKEKESLVGSRANDLVLAYFAKAFAFMPRERPN